MPRNSNSNGLDLQTTVSAHIERKCVFGAVTNPAVDPLSKLSAASATITITPAPSGIGRFEARLDGNDRILCVSRTPLFDAARALVAAGYEPNLMLSLRHAGSATDSLRAKLGAAASLTVEETDFGPKLRQWKPFPTLAVKPRIAFDDLTAITPAPHPRRAQPGEAPGVEKNFETTP
jgi:hypothetical protein